MLRLAALLFAVQGVLLAFSQGASADAVRVDQFGNVLCLASADGHHGSVGEKSSRHSDLKDCCTLGCAMFASVAPAPHGGVLLVDTPVAAASAAFVSYADVLAGVEDGPRRTRGPPRAV